ncbi:MAG: hypothetical protein AAGG01_22020, partial [Planctomycetota bacterium]
ATAVAAPGFSAPTADATAAPSAPEPVAIQLTADLSGTAPPRSTFGALAVSVQELQAEIRVLLEIASERSVPKATLERLAYLHGRAEIISALARSLQAELDAASPAESR